MPKQITITANNDSYAVDVPISINSESVIFFQALANITMERELGGKFNPALNLAYNDVGKSMAIGPGLWFYPIPTQVTKLKVAKDKSGKEYIVKDANGNYVVDQVITVPAKTKVKFGDAIDGQTGIELGVEHLLITMKEVDEKYSNNFTDAQKIAVYSTVFNLGLTVFAKYPGVNSALHSGNFERYMVEISDIWMFEENGVKKISGALIESRIEEISASIQNEDLVAQRRIFKKIFEKYTNFADNNRDREAYLGNKVYKRVDEHLLDVMKNKKIWSDLGFSNSPSTTSEALKMLSDDLSSNINILEQNLKQDAQNSSISGTGDTNTGQQVSLSTNTDGLYPLPPTAYTPTELANLVNAGFLESNPAVQVTFNTPTQNNLSFDISRDNYNMASQATTVNLAPDNVYNAFAATGTFHPLSIILASSPNYYVNIDPLVLDLDGDGIELLLFGEKETYFDTDNDGFKERTGWVGKDDGILVHDHKGVGTSGPDGKITDITETISEYYKAPAGGGALGGPASNPFKSGFDALKTLDSNGDGLINSADSTWSELRIWQDTNGDGISHSTGLNPVSELKTLASLGITEIKLANTADGSFISGNEVRANGSYTMNGTSKTVSSVNFLSNTFGLVETANPSGSGLAGKTYKVQGGNNTTYKTYAAGNTGESVNLTSATYSTYNNIIGGTGDDTLKGNSQDNWLVGNIGKDKFDAGDGDDYVVADATDITTDQSGLKGGNGYDTIQFVGSKGVSFNLRKSGFELAIGTNHADILISGSPYQTIIAGGGGRDMIYGGSATDVLHGEDGNDIIYGYQGNDILRGHRGVDILMGGEGDDMIQGGLGNDVLSGGKGRDFLEGGSGNDAIDGGDGIDIAQYSGSYGDYQIYASKDSTGTITSYTVKDKRTGSPDGTDTLKNVENISFHDIKIMPIVGPQPVPKEDKIKVSKDSNGSYTIKASDLVKNDAHYQKEYYDTATKKFVKQEDIYIYAIEKFIGGAATYTTKYINSIVGNVIEDITFTPTAGFTGIPSFSYKVKDSKGQVAPIVVYDGKNAEVTGKVLLHTDDHPDDPLFMDQWYLPAIDVLPVWKDYTGQGVKVGVTETGPAFTPTGYGQIDYTHPDLKDNIATEDVRTRNPNIEATTYATAVCWRIQNLSRQPCATGALPLPLRLAEHPLALTA